MKIEDFLSLLSGFNKVWFEFPDTQDKSSGELPLFEKTSPYSKYSKAEYSNDSMDVYVGYMDMGIVHMEVDQDEHKKLGFDKHQATQYMNKKIFIEGAPVYEHLAIICHKDELHKIKDDELCYEIYMSSESIDEKFPDMCSIVIDLEKITFNHFNTGKPDYNKVAKLAVELAKLKANKKVHNWFIELNGLVEKEDKYSGLNLKFSSEQVEILKKNRINDYGYTPAPNYSKKIAPMAIKVSGMSNLPKVDDIIKRINENKQQTTAGSIMLPTVETIRGLDDNKIADIVIMLHELEVDIDFVQRDMRNEIYNIILNDHLKSKGERTEKLELESGDFKVTLEMKK